MQPCHLFENIALTLLPGSLTGNTESLDQRFLTMLTSSRPCPWSRPSRTIWPCPWSWSPRPWPWKLFFVLL